MELHQIRYFLELADTLNFTEAARKSNIAQPSLTKSIKRLEDELGGLLVYRDGKDTRLTTLGKQVVVEFSRIIQIEDDVYKLARKNVSGEKVLLNFGVMTTVSPKPISRFINFILKEIPLLEINLHPLFRMNAVEELLSGRYNGCFLGDYPLENKKLSILSLYNEEFHVACSKLHKFAYKKTVPLQDLAGEMYVDRLFCEYRTRIFEYLMKHDVLMQPRFASEREDWVQQVVASGNGICMLPRYSSITDNIVTRPVENLNLTRTVVFASVSGSGNEQALHQVRVMASEFNWGLY